MFGKRRKVDRRIKLECWGCHEQLICYDDETEKIAKFYGNHPVPCPHRPLSPTR